LLYSIFCGAAITFLNGCAFGIGCTLTIGTIGMINGNAKNGQKALDQNDRLLSARQHTNNLLEGLCMQLNDLRMVVERYLEEE